MARQILVNEGTEEDPVIAFVDDTLVWSSSDLLMEVSVDSIGKMLGTATKKATVKLLGIVDGFEVNDPFQIRLGIFDSVADDFEYISEGFFRIDTVDYDYDAGFTTITMYDAMWTASNTLYSGTAFSELTYPITVWDLATEVARVLNVNLTGVFDMLPNAAYEITEDLYSEISGTTLQHVIRDIAGATGTTAHMTDNILHFRHYDPNEETLDSNVLKTLKIGETYGPITSVVLGRVPQNDNIAVSASTPVTTLVTAVDDTTDLLTITEHGMINGNMIRFTSTGTMPAPLVTNQFYYIHTNAADTFALAPTYADAIAGTNLIDITSTGTGDINVTPIIAREIQINNNEVLDDARQDLLPPLYNKLSGIYWTDVKADTVGHGWYEVGDVIHFTQGSITVRAFIEEVHLTLTGAIKEQVVSTIPDVASINYAAAGGILKTIYNTEIKVDKQDQTITSVVSRQDTLEGQLNEDYTQISQDVDDVMITIQNSGGGNLLLNSVGYAKEQTPDINAVNYARLVSWDYPENYSIADHGTVSSYDSSESRNYGGISGRVIQLSSDFINSETVSIEQRVDIGVGIPLSFGVRVRNDLGMGEATITLYNDNDTFIIPIDDTNNVVWEEYSLVNFETTMPWLKVKIEASAEAIRFTDLRLLYGSTLQGWVQANGEILGANVQFTKDGMRIFNENNETETRVTHNEFSTRRRTDNTVLFEADDTGVITNDLTIKGSTSYVKENDIIIKQITIDAENIRAGIAFVKGQDV